MDLVVSPGRVTRFLCAVVAGCVLANVTVEVITRSVSERPDWLWLIFDKFNMDDESNVPTWFSSAVMGWCALLLQVIATGVRRWGEPRSGQWTALSVLFAAMAADEISSVHELPSDALRAAFSTTGLLWAGWVIAALPLIAVVGVMFFGFVRALEPRTRRWLVGGGLLFLAGCVGMEMVDGALWEAYGPNSLIYTVGALIEETMELSGMVVFSHGLLLHLAARRAAVRFQEGLPAEAGAS